MLTLPQALYDQLRQHGESTYPQESCGILLGRTDCPAGREVTAALPAANASPRPHHHYEIAALDLIHAEREARDQSLEILGFYHSHPDHPAEPSPTDLAEGHGLGCSYLITSIQSGHAQATHAFQLAGNREEDKHYEPEDLRIPPA
jgi:proteasome lid subunit RPN8/RPN11